MSTWRDGLFRIRHASREQELAPHSVRGLASDGRGGALAIIDECSVARRGRGGEWDVIATAELRLACCVAVGQLIYAGTDDARVVRVRATGEIEPLRGLDTVAGRDKWYAGAAIIDGRRVGPPLGIRSMTATSDGAVLLANVHVGGIPRSVDGGTTWRPTIDIDSDVHEVRAHPSRPNVVVAAAAVGLCVSGDGGATWGVDRNGLHAPYCSAVGLVGDDVLVAASTDHFASQGAIYRRTVDGHGPLAIVRGGLPPWLDGIVDTGCIATHGSTVAVVDRRGNLHVSADAGEAWFRWAEGLPGPSGVLIV